MLSKSKKISIREKLNSEFPFRNLQVDTLCNLLIEVSIIFNMYHKYIPTYTIDLKLVIDLY